MKQHQYSEELQLVGRTDQLQYVAGAFYYHGSAADDAQTPLDQPLERDRHRLRLRPTRPRRRWTSARVTIDRASRALHRQPRRLRPGHLDAGRARATAP